MIFNLAPDNEAIARQSLELRACVDFITGRHNSLSISLEWVYLSLFIHYGAPTKGSGTGVSLVLRRAIQSFHRPARLALCGFYKDFLAVSQLHYGRVTVVLYPDWPRLTTTRVALAANRKLRSKAEKRPSTQVAAVRRLEKHFFGS